MKKHALLLTLILLSSSACCMHKVHRDDFDQLPLAAQIEAYRVDKSRDCIRNDRLGLLMKIASHGYAAAEAMVTALDKSPAGFPKDDAITVLRHVHLDGYDLRQHEALRALERLAATSDDPLLGEQARTAAAMIRETTPKMTPE